MDRFSALVITPIKNSLDNSLKTIETVKNSDMNIMYYIYDDFSDENISLTLKENSRKLDYSYIHLSHLTNTPSPNYLTTLKDAQSKALSLHLPLIIVESDVEVQEDTIRRLIDFQKSNTNIGMIGAITVDESNNINYPYLKFKDLNTPFHKTKRSLSFCCTLLSIDFLKTYDFINLDGSKDWFDTTISNASIANGFDNYILSNVRVLHKPHSSRPWKQMKYKNPIKYYWNKLIKGRDKI